VLSDSHSILNKWWGLCSQALYIRGVRDVRQKDVQTAEPLVAEPRPYEIYVAIEDLKIYKSLGNAQIAADLIRTRNRLISYKIHNITNSIWNKEELPQQWKESIIVPIYNKGDKTDCSNCRDI